MNPLSKFQVGKDYPMSFIDIHLNEPTMMSTYYGAYIVGNYFLAIDDDEDDTVSFVLSGANATEDIFTCVYNDVEFDPALVRKSYVILNADNEWMATGHLETTEEIAATIAECKERRPDIEMILYESENSYVIQ